MQLMPLRESRFFLSLRTAGAFLLDKKSQKLYKNNTLLDQRTK